MIAGLRGKIVRLGASTVYLDTGGVIYEIHVPLNVFEQMQKPGPKDEVYLHIFHHFMQDEAKLFGFGDLNQRELFIAIKGLKGIGTSLALSILSHLNGELLLQFCESKDVKGLTKIPRVGKSTAETIVFEVNRKIDKWKKLVSTDSKVLELLSSEEELAREALLQLGYKEKELEGVFEKLSKTSKKPLPAADLIKEALRLL